MRYNLMLNGEFVNDIICEPDFVPWYAKQHGYTYEEAKEQNPAPPITVSTPTYTADDLFTALLGG